MAVSGSAYTATHHGTTFHFCSAQCLTRFLESPALYAGAPLSPQAVRALIKRRVLRIEHGPGLDEACRRIEAMMGVMDEMLRQGHASVLLLNQGAGFLINPLDVAGVAILISAGKRVAAVWKPAVLGGCIGILLRTAGHILLA